ncbi:MAG TPA: RnfABCDGE type electron transport complex subunit D [Candidatus Dormibacteraeota bacterium]
MGRLAFRPDSLEPSLVYVIALLPPVAAGLVLFGLPAAYDAALAVAIGGVFHGALRLAKHPPVMSPIVTALVGVALIGPGAAWWWAAVVAGAACILETARTFAPRPALPFSSGLLAYAAVYLAGHGAVGSYLAPGRSGRHFPEPIALWHQFFAPDASPIDPVTLYVGNVAGPVFATSLLAVGIGVAWLWYADRLDVLPIVGFAAGALVVTIGQRWSPAFQLLSGPLLFALTYGFADRKLLAGAPILGVVFGFAAAFVGIGLRTRGYGVEVAFISLAGVQVAVAGFVALARTFRSGAPRRLMAFAWASQPYR